MARLSQQQALALLKANQSKEVIDAINEEKRARFYTEPALSPDCQSAFDDFKLWVKNIIDPVKYSVFETLNILPIATVNVTDGIFKEVKKVFNAQDRYIGYELASEDMRQDMTDYLDAIGDNNFWSSKGFEAMKNRYNSFIIIDLPGIDDQNAVELDTRLGGLPQPYYYLLPIEYLITTEINPRTNNLEYIAFKDMDNPAIAYVFDDAVFRKYSKDDRGEYQLISGDIPHELGKTPACKFWNDPSSLTNKIRNVGLISKSLGELQKLLFNLIGKDHADLYVKWPITVSYKQKCTYEDGEGNACDDGWIRRPMKTSLDPSAASMVMSDPIACPNCSGGRNKWFGAGTHVEAPGRTSTDDPDMLDGVRIISGDVTSLEHIQKDLDRAISWLTFNMIGVTDEIVNQAINEKQVLGSFEGRQGVLDDVAACYEKAHKFVLDAIGVFRYGKKGFKGSTVNYGRQFFLHTVSEMNDTYQKGKTSGLPAYELAAQRNQIYEAKYQNNPEMLQRIRILSNLEPYQDYTPAEISQMSTSLDSRLLRLKANFDQYIKRFEREYTNVVSFMQFSNFDTKIDIINEKLMMYVDEAVMLNQTQLQDGQENSGQAGARPNPPGNGGTPPPAN